MSVALQYIVFGFALAVPYAHLSGGGFACLVLGSVFLPVVVLLSGFGRRFGYGLFLLVSLPILLNGLAMVLRTVDPEIAMIVAGFRFHPLWIAPVVYLLCDVMLYFRSYFEERNYRAD